MLTRQGWAALASAASLVVAGRLFGLVELYVLGAGTAALVVVAFIVVKWLMRYIQTHRFTVFAVYRIVLGVLLLLLLPSGS